ncbi:hypothetical protein WMY93_007573 [Mugilogobius chulae]|uniref:LIM zinc-binding domain-containing protein n=1 Tax=Mugilogobius chulae TaxID=88201 RepID=A0AAW0PDE7_9GOBI
MTSCITLYQSSEWAENFRPISSGFPSYPRKPSFGSDPPSPPVSSPTPYATTETPGPTTDTATPDTGTATPILPDPSSRIIQFSGTSVQFSGTSVQFSGPQYSSPGPQYGSQSPQYNTPQYNTQQYTSPQYQASQYNAPTALYSHNGSNGSNGEKCLSNKMSGLRLSSTSSPEPSMQSPGVDTESDVYRMLQDYEEPVHEPKTIRIFQIPAGHPRVRRRRCVADGQTEESEKLPQCTRCCNGIVGTIVKARDKLYHPDCFMCDDCNINLKKRGYFFIEESLYCEACAMARVQLQRVGGNTEKIHNDTERTCKVNSTKREYMMRIWSERGPTISSLSQCISTSSASNPDPAAQWADVISRVVFMWKALAKSESRRTQKPFEEIEFISPTSFIK